MMHELRSAMWYNSARYLIFVGMQRISSEQDLVDAFSDGVYKSATYRQVYDGLIMQIIMDENLHDSFLQL